MESTLKDAERRSAAAATKAERARDGEQAMREYEAERLALQANTARLRALRLANEAGNAQPSEKPSPAKKQAVRRVSPAKRASGPRRKSP